MCGKDIGDSPEVQNIEGSPPRVREGQIIATKDAQKARITPACAGRTPTGIHISCKQRDHPRVCGKDKYEYSDDLLKEGSPPRVREGPWKSNYDKGKFRITPACAGRTLKDPVFCNVLF